MPLTETREGIQYFYEDEQWLSAYHWRDIVGVNVRIAIVKSGAQTRTERIPDNYDGYGMRIMVPVSDFPKIMETLSRNPKHSWAQGINFSEDFIVQPPSVISGGLIYRYNK